MYLTFRPPLFVQFLDATVFDVRLLLRGERDPGDEVVIVAVDDKSLDNLGVNVWSRRNMADLINGLTKYEPAVIGIDYLYPLPEITPGPKAIGNIDRRLRKFGGVDPAMMSFVEQQAREANPDMALETAIRNAGNVVLAFAPRFDAASATKVQTHLPDGFTRNSLMLIRGNDYYTPITASHALTPLQPFADAALSLAHVYTQYEADGAIRWEPLYVQLEDNFYPSLGFELMRNYFGLHRDEIMVQLGDRILLGDEEHSILTDPAGRALINFAGPDGTIRRVSAIDVMQGKVAEEALADKLVLIGLTALGAGDTHVTPFSTMPGVEKQATVAENLLHGNFIVHEEITALAAVVAIVLFPILLTLAVSSWGALAGASVFISMLACEAGFAEYQFQIYNAWVSGTVPVGSLIVLYALLESYRFFTEERRSRAIKEIFSHYTTAKVVNELIEHPEMAKLGGVRKDITVMFSDVRSFTTFSEAHTPEEVVSMLNEILHAMTEVIMHWDGTLDKFVGDEIMAFWGAPLDQPDHAERAVRCSFHMLNRLQQLHAKWEAESNPKLDIGIGLNTGDMVVGNIGSENLKMDYTVIGDAVNLGARVEALTRNYKTHIIITEYTYERIRHLLPDENGVVPENGIGHLRVDRLDEVKVKGKNVPVVIYGLLDLDLPDPDA
ncbi:MAG: adenylate/guanylate cyclase domain-containing protein [Mariprofundaceae bacterium]|nr:adenylate/guanylate cyclase domain-containing protein [Mariprofundaceae bacterium]